MYDFTNKISFSFQTRNVSTRRRELAVRHRDGRPVPGRARRGVLLQQRGRSTRGRGSAVAEGRREEDLETIPFCPQIFRPLLRAEGQEDVQRFGLPRNL
jgi:hypothetical protein